MVSHKVYDITLIEPRNIVVISHNFKGVGRSFLHCGDNEPRTPGPTGPTRPLILDWMYVDYLDANLYDIHDPDPWSLNVNLHVLLHMSHINLWYSDSWNWNWMCYNQWLFSRFLLTSRRYMVIIVQSVENRKYFPISIVFFSLILLSN